MNRALEGRLRNLEAEHSVEAARLLSLGVGVQV